MHQDDAEAIRKWFMVYNNKVRMEYGMAMALVGFDEDVIVEVQQAVAHNMVEWLDTQI